MSSPRPLRASAFLREGAVALFFVALAAVATRPLVRDLRGQTLVGPDPLIDLWTVHWLSGHAFHPGALFEGNIYHPHPNAVLYSDLSMGTALLLVPLRVFVQDPVPLYNVGLLLAFAFSGWAFHALTRDLTGSRSAGLLAGVLAAFGSHQMSHVYHLNLLTTGWLALLLLALRWLVRGPSLGPVLLAGGSFALSAQSSGYYAVAAAVLAVVFAAVHWRAFRERRVLWAAGAAALTGALLLAPYSRAFLSLREREGLRRPPGMSERMAFDPGRDLSSYGYLYRGVLGSGGERLFPGALTLVLASIAVARRRPGSGFLAAAAAVLLVLSLGPTIRIGESAVPLPYRLLFAIPPLDNMRHPYTFAGVATLLLAALAGLGWSSLAVSSRRWGSAVVALAIVETLGPPPSLRRVPAGVPPAYQRLETLPPGAILEVPVSAPETLLWAARHGQPVVNGIGAFAPRETAVLERYIQNHWLRKAPEEVDVSPPAGQLARHFPVRYVIVPAGRKPPFRRLARAFEGSRAFVLVAEAADGDRIYEFRKENVPLSDAGEGREEPAEVSGQEGEPVRHEE